MQRYSTLKERKFKAQQVYCYLVNAATNRQILTYDHVRKHIGYKGAGVLGPILDYIFRWCKKNNLPMLTSLVVNSNSGVPGIGLAKHTNSVTKELQKVHNFDWADIVAPTADELEAAFKGN
jgi:hypothetical protein